ncbi:hypothetical protein [Nitrosomonas sp.]|uniref:hypothetical protein n=1 Tax=Nitrosomonas sp. TaxID=42353 RepID=UPI0025E4C928|nr:hypothetical protein [Nitrosomonas sp.]MBV6446770.1 hypothetical protein [Nitrosomonas sp.]
MFNSCSAVNATIRITVFTVFLTVCTTTIASAQSSGTDQGQRQPQSQHLTTQPSSESPPDVNRPPRIIHRTGTAIAPPRNSVSIKSTDAGIIHRQPPASGCSNCGIIDFVNKIGQGPGLNAIAGGVIAGTVAREVTRQNPYPHGTGNPSAIPDSHAGGIAQPHNQYQVGITMSDGSQAIIALPDATQFHQGDRVKWVDGVLMIDRQQ